MYLKESLKRVAIHSFKYEEVDLYHVISDTPSAPRILQVKDRNKDYIDISWSPPETDGGSEVRQYVIEKRDVTRGLGSWMVSGTAIAADCNFRVSKLLEGNAYQLRVSAENRVGVGPPVELQEPVVAQLPFGKFHDFSLQIHYAATQLSST